MGDIEMRLQHDRRTPLNAMIGYSEIVIEDLSGSAADLLKPDLEKLLGEARRLLGLVDVIIDFSQRELERPDQDGDGPGDPAIAELQRTIRPDGGAAQGHEPGRILVVDDNASNRELLRRRLMHEGHEDRKRVGRGTDGSVRVGRGSGRLIKKKNNKAKKSTIHEH